MFHCHHRLRANYLDSPRPHHACIETKKPSHKRLTHVSARRTSITRFLELFLYHSWRARRSGIGFVAVEMGTQEKRRFDLGHLPKLAHHGTHSVGMRFCGSNRDDLFSLHHRRQKSKSRFNWIRMSPPENSSGVLLSRVPPVNPTQC